MIVALEVMEAVGVREEVRVVVLVEVGEGVDLGETEGVGVDVLVGVCVPVILGVLLPEREMLGVLLLEAPGEREAVGLPDTVGSADSVEEGVGGGV